MILFPTDIPYLPSKLLLKKNTIEDMATEDEISCNETVINMLKEVDGKRNIDAISKKISKTYDIPYNEAANDVITLFENLNENHLLNIIKKDYKNRFKMLFVFIYTLQLNRIFHLLNTRRRYDIPEKFRSPFFLYIYFIVKLLIIHPILFLIMYTFFVSSPLIDYGKALVFTLNIFLAIATHEFFHALALYTVDESRKLSFIGKDRFTIGIYRRQTSPLKSIFVSLAGPLFPFLIGLFLYRAGIITGNQDILYASVIWVANILTLLSVDGKNIRVSLSTLIKGRSLKND
ncbi:PqqD family peptide modification chaperone [Domibacillus sp. PGB-M46]|uniref:PqqD family peptide modification chaperone n=1 Tax=Domibacillus sp. PGB-M46 TaxID=2910255 RepID=UPI001F56E897|nr:PqqD family peptide modification chaperone [Domibacillus sp. PGB-M46]MCI2254820.1 PqqD family peptide modification chaperone [Domibacillus sp. PGB-M46]